MASRKQIERYKDFYRRGLWSDWMLDQALERGKITEAERDEIRAPAGGARDETEAEG